MHKKLGGTVRIHKPEAEQLFSFTVDYGVISGETVVQEESADDTPPQPQDETLAVDLPEDQWPPFDGDANSDEEEEQETDDEEEEGETPLKQPAPRAPQPNSEVYLVSNGTHRLAGLFARRRKGGRLVEGRQFFTQLRINPELNLAYIAQALDAPHLGRPSRPKVGYYWD